MTGEFKIEKNVEQPKPQSGRGLKYPFHKMEVSDSFFIPVAEEKSKVKIGNSIRAAARNASLRHKNTHRFSYRKVEGGVRVWRIE